MLSYDQKQSLLVEEWDATEIAAQRLRALVPNGEKRNRFQAPFG
jgi:hypothetical protein